MLVLSRKLDQRIILTLPDGSRITVAVVDIRGGWDGKVRIGIAAPPEVRVNREEVEMRLDREGVLRRPRPPLADGRGPE
jgi:carbon storage regulator CsrA